MSKGTDLESKTEKALRTSREALQGILYDIAEDVQTSWRVQPTEDWEVFADDGGPHELALELQVTVLEEWTDDPAPKNFRQMMIDWAMESTESERAWLSGQLRSVADEVDALSAPRAEDAGIVPTYQPMLSDLDGRPVAVIAGSIEEAHDFARQEHLDQWFYVEAVEQILIFLSKPVDLRPRIVRCGSWRHRPDAAELIKTANAVMAGMVAP